MAAAVDLARDRVVGDDRPPYLAGLIASSPQLRRDISNAVRVGISPRRYAGWEPATQYSYDDQGRIGHTTPEPEWDEWDTTLVDEWLNWTAGIHPACGHHPDELGPDDTYIATYSVCPACVALQQKQEQQAAVDKPELDKGRNPDYVRRWRANIISRAELARRTEERAQRKSPLQIMQEAVAKLDQDGAQPRTNDGASKSLASENST